MLEQPPLMVSRSSAARHEGPLRFCANPMQFLLTPNKTLLSFLSNEKESRFIALLPESEYEYVWHPEEPRRNVSLHSLRPRDRLRAAAHRPISACRTCRIENCVDPSALLEHAEMQIKYKLCLAISARNPPARKLPVPPRTGRSDIAVQCATTPFANSRVLARLLNGHGGEVEDRQGNR